MYKKARATKWAGRFLRQAQEVATWSKDPSTKVGCIIANDAHQVLALGYNGFPSVIPDKKEYLETKATKLALVLCAEMNAVLNATTSLKGATAYVTHRPCSRCTMVLLQAGLKRVVYLNPHPENWRNDSQELLREVLEELEIDFVEVTE